MENIKQINLMDFEDEFGKMISWFNIKNIKAEQTQLCYRRLKTYPIEALKYTVNQFIESRRPSAANFPTINEILDFCNAWLSQRPELKFKRMAFHPEEDFSYPIYKLWDGYKLLRDYGEERFIEFARENRMPRNDIERVMAKNQFVKQDDVKQLVDSVGQAVA